MPSNLTAFWADPYGWPVEKPGFVFLARAMNSIGKALYPTQWTGKEPWTDQAPPALPESPGIDVKIELTKDVERAYRLIGKEIPRPVYAHSGPGLGEKGAPVPEFGPGSLGQGRASQFGPGSFAQSRLKAKTPGLMPSPVFSPAPALTDEEWAEARRRSIEIVLAATAEHERWWQVMQFTWRAFVTDTQSSLKCYLRNDNTGKYEGPTDPDWWNYEGYASRFGLCQLDKGHPTKQRHFERGRNIRSTEFSGSDFRLIFVTEASHEAALADAKSLEIEQPAAPETSLDQLPAPLAAAPTPRAAKGAKKGQGAKDDVAYLARILEMERDEDAKRYAATVAVASAASDGTVTNAKAIERRLWRKVKDMPALPSTDTKTDTKSTA